jgi:arylformamidase
MLIPISYPLNRDAPLIPGTVPLSITSIQSIADGDLHNESLISFSGHSGTRIDLPRHSCMAGGTVSDLLAPESVFEPAYCIEIRKEGEDVLRPQDFWPFLPGIHDAKALFVKTGSGNIRGVNPDIYATVHPWVHPDVPDLLRCEFPDLRVFGIDTISIASPSHTDEATACQRAFLCESPHIFLLEDADLSYGKLLDESWILRVYPVLFDDLDGVPILALAEFR